MKKVYLDNACTSKVNERVLNAGMKYIDLYRTSKKSASDITRECRSYMVRAREQVSKLINSKESEVALVESTSHALGIISEIISLKKKIIY